MRQAWTEPGQKLRLRVAKAAPTAAGAGRTSVATPSKEPKAAQRPIRFPNSASALRQHVASVEAKASVARVRTRPAAIVVDELRVADGNHNLSRLRGLLSRTDPAPPGASETRRPLTFAGGEGSEPLQTVADLGRKVRAGRLQEQLTQEQLAERAGVGRRFVSELELGKPTLEIGRVLRVCHALDIALVVTAPPHG